MNAGKRDLVLPSKINGPDFQNFGSDFLYDMELKRSPRWGIGKPMSYLQYKTKFKSLYVKKIVYEQK